MKPLQLSSYNSHGKKRRAFDSLLTNEMERNLVSIGCASTSIPQKLYTECYRMQYNFHFHNNLESVVWVVNLGNFIFSWTSDVAIHVRRWKDSTCIVWIKAGMILVICHPSSSQLDLQKENRWTLQNTNSNNMILLQNKQWTLHVPCKKKGRSISLYCGSDISYDLILPSSQKIHEFSFMILLACP